MRGVNDTRVQRAAQAGGGAGRAPLVLAGVTAMCLGSLFDIAPTARPLAHPGITTSVTWTRDVGQILERRCTACHRPSGPAPMDLTSFEAARPWARAIREEVLERRMPPTGIRSGAGIFLNARTLSWAESELLVSWADGGAPKGDAPPSSITRGAEWPGGVDAPGTLLDGNPESLERTVRVPVTAGWVQGWSLDPGTWPATSARLRLLRGGVIGSWGAGDPPVHYPEGAGLQIPAGEVLLVDLTLAMPLPQEPEGVRHPTLRVWNARGPLRPVLRQALRPGDVVRSPDMLLALKLDLSEPDARGEVVLQRRDGSEYFLFAMGPPGVPDPVTYRLREPLPRTVGDTIAVRSASRFVLDLETVASTRAKSRTAR